MNRPPDPTTAELAERLHSAYARATGTPAWYALTDRERDGWLAAAAEAFRVARGERP